MKRTKKTSCFFAHLPLLFIAIIPLDECVSIKVCIFFALQLPFVYVIFSLILSFFSPLILPPIGAWISIQAIIIIAFGIPTTLATYTLRFYFACAAAVDCFIAAADAAVAVLLLLLLLLLLSSLLSESFHFLHLRLLQLICALHTYFARVFHFSLHFVPFLFSQSFSF